MSKPSDDDDAMMIRVIEKPFEQLLTELHDVIWWKRRDAARDLGRLRDPRAVG
jgi:hypothetical protein